MQELAKKINEEILNSSVYKRYLNSKKNVENNECLLDLQNNMKILKDKICKEKNDELVEEYYSLDKEYNSHPLVKEYLASKSDLNALLLDISDILSF